jgi:hypothetical protein
MSQVNHQHKENTMTNRSPKSLATQFYHTLCHDLKVECKVTDEQMAQMADALSAIQDAGYVRFTPTTVRRLLFPDAMDTQLFAGKSGYAAFRNIVNEIVGGR